MKSILSILLLAFASFAQAAIVSLAWDANPASDQVLAYKLHAGSVSGAYHLTNNVGTNLVGTFTNLASGPWYFAVTATNAWAESGFSSEVSTVIPPGSPLNLRITNSANTVSINLNPDWPFRIQGSTDLVNWYDLLSGHRGWNRVDLYVDTSDPTEFFRATP